MLHMARTRSKDFGAENLVPSMIRRRGWGIQLLESPIPPTTSQKASSDDISGTKRDIIDPLVSKRPETNFEEEKKNKKDT